MRHAYGNANIHSDVDSDSDCDGNSYIHADGDSNSYPYTDSDGNSYAYTDSNSDGYGYGHSNRNRKRIPAAFTDATATADAAGACEQLLCKY